MPPVPGRRPDSSSGGRSAEERAAAAAERARRRAERAKALGLSDDDVPWSPPQSTRPRDEAPHPEPDPHPETPGVGRIDRHGESGFGPDALVEPETPDVGRIDRHGESEFGPSETLAPAPAPAPEAAAAEAGRDDLRSGGEFGPLDAPEPAPAPEPEPVADAPAPAAAVAPEPAPDPAIIHQPTEQFDVAAHIEDEPAPKRRAAPPPPAEPRPRRAAPPPRSATARTAALRAAQKRQPQRKPARRVPEPTRPPSRTGRRILAALALIAVLVAVWFIYSTFQPGKGEGEGSVAVTVPPGADAGEIGKLLAERGVVASGTFFSVNATLTGRRDELKPGEYTLAQDMSYGAALDAITAGPPPPEAAPTFKVTIPEGRSIREAASAVKKAGVKGSYAKAARSRQALRRARALGLPRSQKTIEGFLFPATYELVKGSDADDLVDKQLDAFEENFAQLELAAARRKNLSRYDVLIIASMVEREAQLEKERPIIAGVIYNRLKEGMTLGIDATIRYVENNWDRPLRVSELQRDTPYNTRINAGLPPTPIGNPGLSSLKAAAKPQANKFLFYVVKPNTCGEHAFSSTDAEFSRDQARYNAERAKAGGNSPTTC